MISRERHAFRSLHPKDKVSQILEKRTSVNEIKIGRYGTFQNAESRRNNQRDISRDKVKFQGILFIQAEHGV